MGFENDKMWLFDPTLPATPAKDKSLRNAHARFHVKSQHHAKACRRNIGHEL